MTVLGEDPFEVYPDKIASITSSFKSADRLRFLKKVTNLLKSDRRRKTEERIVGARILVALLPDSLDSIQELLITRSNRWDYELHFTLFCYLDDSQFLPLTERTKSEVLKLIFDYLVSARVNTALAVWMAGHSLGNHWAGDEALGYLQRAAVKGVYAAGRKGALSGLEDRLKSMLEDQETILKTIQDVSIRDSSQELRKRARLLLKKS